MALSARLVGEKQLRRNLSALERKVLPRAKVNAINRTATRGRKDAITEFARHERRKKKSFRSILRVVQRARVKVREQAIVALFTRLHRQTTKLSPPFTAKGKEYRRRIPGRKWTTGRPTSSSPNLPIFPVVSETADRRAKQTRHACTAAMRDFYPVEVQAQIRNLVAKHIRRHAR
jgi:hypothetical protein